MMAAALTPTLINKAFQNWLKGALAVLFAKEGLIDLVGHETIDFQAHLLQTVYKQNGIPPGTICSSCTTANVLACPTEGFCSKGRKCKAHNLKVPDKKPNIACPNGLCSHIRDAIKNEHRFKRPSWKNTDARRWCSDGFILSKCFMPPDGYSDKTCLADTDFNGILAVVINNNRFQRKMSVNLGLEPNICTKVRIIGREIRHSANHLLSDQDLMKYIDDLITLLSDPAYLATDVKANDAVGKLKELKTNTLTIHADDITNVLNESIITTLDEQQKLCLHDIQEHFNKHETDSIEVIDKKIQECKDELQIQLEEGKDVLNKYTKQGKDELQTQLEQGKDELNKYTKQGKDELQTQLEQGNDELNKYTKQRKDELQTQLEQGKDELNKYTKQCKDELQTQLEQGNDELNRYTKQGKDELQTQLEQGKDELNTHITVANITLNAQTKTIEHKMNESIVLYTRSVDTIQHKSIDELQKVTKTEKQEIEVHGKHVLEQINRYADMNTGETGSKLSKGVKKKKHQFGFWDKLTFKESRLKSGLRRNLIDSYRNRYNTIPVSPLVEEDVVPLEEFYVQPSMTAIDLRRPFGNPVKTAVTSFQELFIQDDGNSYKNIYVTADAGIGKTCFSKYICMHWCQAHKALKSPSNKLKPENISVLKRFSFLFLITLRDMQTSICDLDELVVATLNDNLRTHYDCPLLDKILANKSCLVILEGLDEWSHPNSCKRPHKNDDIPHRKACSNWTILTTLRPWKFDVIRHSPIQIDRHVEINNLDDNSTMQLVENAVYLLNQKSDVESRKTVDDFYREISLNTLGEVRNIPFIYLQCVCLWFDGKNIGETKCDLFTNIIELTLNRGAMKIQSGCALSSLQSENRDIVPKCMIEKPYCIQHLTLLLKLGELAFIALFGVENIQRLVLDVTFARKYLEQVDLDYCLKLGLLSQNKVYGSVAQRVTNVSFQHKSLQEFFAAFYIQANFGSSNNDVLEKCTSVSSILEVSNVLIFLSGCKPQTYSKLSQKINGIMTSEEITCKYRVTTLTYPGETKYNIMSKYQTLQINCTREMKKSQELVPLEDILIDENTKGKEYMSGFQTILHDNQGSLKSLSIQQCKTTAEVTKILETLGLHNIHSLDKLLLWVVVRQPDVEQLLTQSINTLKCLTLRYVNFEHGKCKRKMTVLSDRCEKTILSMPHLQAFDFRSLILTHGQLDSLKSFVISRVTKITEIHMEDIVCSDHEICPGILLNMSRHSNLQFLGLDNVPVPELYVNTEQLEECFIGELPTSVTTTWLTCLPDAQKLRRLHFQCLNNEAISSLTELLPSLLHMEEIHIVFSDLGEYKIRLSVEMTKLKSILLTNVSMTSSVLRTLADSVIHLGQQVTVTMYDCTVTPKEEYDTITEDIGRSRSYTVIKHGYDVYRSRVFEFQTLK